MDINIKKYTNIFIYAFIAVLMCIAFIIRIIPSFYVSGANIIDVVSPDDPMYNLRQIEFLLHNFPNYQWFDPMTLYPVGQTLNWGPLFTFICAIACIIFGATTRPEIIYISLMVPPFLAVLTIPITYCIGKKLCGTTTGICAAIFTTFMFGQFFMRSLYGYLDHHIAEVLFSTLFCFVYIYAIHYMRECNHVINNKINYKWYCISAVSGLTFVLGLYVMPTMILFALIVFVYTLIQILIDAFDKHNSFYLLVLNFVTFIMAIVSLFILGFSSDVLTLVNYSFAHIIVFSILILETILFYSIKDYQKLNAIVKKFPVYFFGSIIAAIIVFLLNLPESWGAFLDGGVRGFFGTTMFSITVQEARGWTLADAIGAFNISLILAAIGILLSCYIYVKYRKSGIIFSLIWFGVILLSTIQHIRYEYYMAIPLAIFSGIAVGYIIEKCGPNVIVYINSILLPEKEIVPELKTRRERKNKSARKPKMSYLNYICIIVLSFALIMSGMFVYNSANNEYMMSGSGYVHLNGDWKSAVEWFGINTPETGIDYYKLYNENVFSYPDTAYGVMSWWDYGHLITYISKRIPNSNPFQAGVYGPNGSAAYFMSEDETNANLILDNDGTRYIITDIEMATGKFWAMATWYNTTLGGIPYQPVFIVKDQDNPTSGRIAQVFTSNYYMTMVTRLHNFDGSYTVPSDVIYAEYMEPSISKTQYPLIIAATKSDSDTIISSVHNYNLKALNGYGAIAINTDPTKPVVNIPALKHYRLVYESPTSTIIDGTTDIKYVKIFEYVKGYEIQGEGLIELPVKTNTGREFIYRQKSENGKFVVPYSTSGNKYPVYATGKYHIVDTDICIGVDENDIM